MAQGLRRSTGGASLPMQGTTILILRCDPRRCGSIVGKRASKDALPSGSPSCKIV